MKIKTGKTMPYTPLQLAEAFIQTGELQDALDALNQHLEATPADDDARRLRVQVLIRMRDSGSYHAALEDLARLMHLTSQDKTNRYVILDRLEDSAGALEAVEELYEDDPSDQRVAEWLFDRAITLKEYALADEVLKTMPRSSGWLTNAGHLASVSGHLEDAPGYYTDALKQLGVEYDLSTSKFARPIHVGLLLVRARTYVTLKKFHEASEDYAAAQAIMPDDPLIGFWHSYVLLDLGHIQEAVVTCRIALQTSQGPLKSQMVNYLRSRLDDPKFAPLVALLDEMG
jgi:tetratricopeptide (TPR) repeat protein